MLPEVQRAFQEAQDEGSVERCRRMLVLRKRLGIDGREIVSQMDKITSPDGS
jgi:hypothetical protein